MADCLSSSTFSLSCLAEFDEYKDCYEDTYAKDHCGVDERVKMARERLHEIQQQTADGKYQELMEEGSS